MLDFERMSDDGDEVAYRYLCEGDASRSGVVRFSRSTGDVTSVERAKGDELGIYWGHMSSRLREMCKDDDFEKSGMVAW